MTQCIVYADGILGRGVNCLNEVFEEMKQRMRKVGLEINQGKTKYMIITWNKYKLQGVHEFRSGDISYERVETFKYLGTVLNEGNDIGVEIRSRVSAGNKCYYALCSVTKSKSISRQSKLKIYRTIITPVVMYASETWVLKEKEIRMLSIWERKILRKIYGTKKERKMGNSE
jgi:hypothetical protein